MFDAKKRNYYFLMEKMNLNDEYGILLKRVNHPMPLYSNLYSINT